MKVAVILLLVFVFSSVIGTDYEYVIPDAKSVNTEDNLLLVHNESPLQLFGGEGDPDHDDSYEKPIFGGEGDPDHDDSFENIIVGGMGDPDHGDSFEKPIFGGKGDPDHDYSFEKPILGGEGDPDHDDSFGKPIFGGKGDLDHEKPLFGGKDDLDHENPIFGGKGDPDHKRTIFGGKDDPDSEFDETKDWPGKFEEKEEAEAPFKPIIGKDPARQTLREQPDLPIGYDPCSKHLTVGTDPVPLDVICKEEECPDFTVVEIPEACGFEARKYKASVWAAIRFEDPQSSSEAIKKLYGYVYGENERNETLPITLPLAFYTIMKDHTTIEATFVAYYIPKMFQTNPPIPHDKAIHLVEMNEMLLYVRAFGNKGGSMPSPDDYKKQFMALYTAISKVGRMGHWATSMVFEYFQDDKPERHEVIVPDVNSFLY